MIYDNNTTDIIKTMHSYSLNTMFIYLSYKYYIVYDDTHFFVVFFPLF